MNNKLILAKEIVEIEKNKLIKKIKEAKDNNLVLTLAIIFVGDNPASQVYVRNKKKFAEDIGVKAIEYKFTADISEKELIAQIESLNANNSVHGILVQLPLPGHIDENKILDSIAFTKDVDGFSYENAGLLFQNRPNTISCTPFGIMKLFEHNNIKLEGKDVLVIGRSNIVGRPMAVLLLNEGATVTIAHSKTRNLSQIASKMDIIIIAIGKAKFLKAEMIKEGAVIIDVGINRVDGKICGDVDFDDVIDKVSMITPVPGGVGPMTILMLYENLYNLGVKYGMGQ